MKNTTLTILALLLSLSLSANTEKTTDGDGTGVNKTKSEEPSTKGDEENESSEEAVPQEEIEVDSSYYAVSKFNSLFYFLYKLNYFSEDLPEEEE